MFNDPLITAGGTGNATDVLTSSANFTFISDTATANVSDGNMFCNNDALIPGNSFNPFALQEQCTVSNANQRTGIQAGGPGDPQSIADNAEQAAQNSVFVTGNQPQQLGNAATGGLFVIKTGYMYTHNCGINDFYVESSMNLAYRD